MSERNFNQLIDAQAARGNHLSVGIDIDWNKVPEGFGSQPTGEGMFRYGAMVMDHTAHVAAMFKPNQEFFAAYLKEGGLDALARLVEYGHTAHPDIPIIIDAKQGDIGRTNEMALKGVFEELADPDGMTIHPWMGKLAMQTHWSMKDKGFFVIAKTSNKGGGEFQDLPVSDDLSIENMLERWAAKPDMRAGLFEKYLTEGLELGTLQGRSNLHPEVVRFRPLWQLVTRHATSPEGWNVNGNVGVVIGATYEEEAKSARQFAHESPILSPGLGTQGGVIVDMRNSKGSGVVYNSASGVMLPTPEQIDEAGSVEGAIRNNAEITHHQIQKALQI